ncbi:hypothetical protein A45J_2699 [hot springs metagenome]|uniref:Uncharacterized protein n=1 Tax=hot springs metagenome TaxID=433727 RepID=A0A5J4L5L5_9ZZZZ
MKRTEVISIKTTEEVKEKLIQLAERGYRSLSREMERLIEEAYFREFGRESSPIRRSSPVRKVQSA